MIYGIIKNNKLIGYALSIKAIPKNYKYVIYKNLKEYNLHRWR